MLLLLRKSCGDTLHKRNRTRPVPDAIEPIARDALFANRSTYERSEDCSNRIRVATAFEHTDDGSAEVIRVMQPRINGDRHDVQGVSGDTSFQSNGAHEFRYALVYRERRFDLRKSLLPFAFVGEAAKHVENLADFRLSLHLHSKGHAFSDCPCGGLSLPTTMGQA